VDVSTRPSHQHRQRAVATRRALAVFLFLGLSGEPAIPAPSRDDLKPAKPTLSLPRRTTHEIVVASVEPGQESIALAARLTDTSAFIARDVTWQVRDEDGEVLLDSTSNELQSPLPPGEYEVHANYGAVSLREIVRLPEGSSVAVNFILNAGGLRVLPSIRNMADGAFESKTIVFALTGVERGKRVAHSDIPGELLKLAAGTYRVESRFGLGNTKAIMDVVVRPGKLSAVELTHDAGVVELRYGGQTDANVIWSIQRSDGEVLKPLVGLTQRLPLKPGDYVAEANVDGIKFATTFTVTAGEENVIVLGK
jgi:hypothetical protein